MAHIIRRTATRRDKYARALEKAISKKIETDRAKVTRQRKHYSLRKSPSKKSRKLSRRKSPRKEKRKLNAYQKHVRRERLAGKSMKQAAKSWKKNKLAK